MDGEIVRHKCDNAMCCNPYHLERGEQPDNENDKYLRDRAGMPVAVVREIRLLLSRGLTDKLIAGFVSSKFGVEVSRPYVTKISLGIRRAQGGERTAEEIANEAIGGTEQADPV